MSIARPTPRFKQGDRVVLEIPEHTSSDQLPRGCYRGEILSMHGINKCVARVQLLDQGKSRYVSASLLRPAVEGELLPWSRVYNRINGREGVLIRTFDDAAQVLFDDADDVELIALSVIELLEEQHEPA